MRRLRVRPYLPNINHKLAAANAQFVDDAVYWLDGYDLDGLRLDAVKHVPEVATRNLAAEVREQFEARDPVVLDGRNGMGGVTARP